MATRKNPSAALVKDLEKVLKKHKWSGGAIALHKKPFTATEDACPPGTRPQEVTYQRPDGTWVTKIVCVPE